MAKRGEQVATTDWVPSWYEWCAEAGEATGCLIQISMTPTKRLNVFRVVVRALERVEGRPVAVRVQVAGEWPNVGHKDMGAFVMNLLMQLDHEMAYDGISGRQAS